MERHASYKPSGLSWLGDIPSDWALKKTKFLWRERDDRSVFGEEQLLSVSQYTGVIPRVEDSRSESLADYKRCQPDDLVINIMLAWMGGLGVSSHAGIVSPAYCVYRQRENHSSRYLGYLYRSPQYLAEFARCSKGVVPSRWRMYTEDFGQILTLLPPREEQDRIVTFLDQKAAEIDGALAKKERLIALLLEQKRCLIHSAVTRGLRHNIQTRRTSLPWLPEVPANWDIARLKTVASFITSGPRGWSDRITDAGSYFVQSGNLNDSLGVNIEDSHRVAVPKGAEAIRTRLRDGDVVICITGANTGRVAVARLSDQEAYINQHLSLARPQSVNSRFVAYSLSAQGATYFELCQYGLKEGLSLFDVANAPLALPPKEEQNEIVKFLDQCVAKIDAVIATAKDQISQLNDLKRITTADTITGRIKV